jgi:regulator of protease activity HflC (stomatin/prohibitin superfamily)
MPALQSVLTEYQKAPQVTRDRLYLDAMQQVYSNVTKVMVDSRAAATCSICRWTSCCSRAVRAA